MYRLERIILSAVAAAIVAQAHLALAVPVTGGAGPGGLGTTDGTSTLELWFKADTSVFSDTAGTTAATNNDPVGNWNNLSGFVDTGNPYNAIGDVGGREPTFLTGQTPNGGPVLDFVGGVINTGSRLHVTEVGTYAMSGNETAFFALDFDQTCCRGILSGNNSPNRAWAGGSNTMFGDTAPDPPGVPNNFTYASNYRVDGIDTPTTGAGSFHIVTGEDNPTAASNVQLLFGSGHGGNPDYGGRLAEAIVFDEDMNVAQEIVVENYLSSKHGISLAAGDRYAGDTGGNGDYDFDVFGVGRQDASNTHTSGGSAGFGIEAVVSSLDADDEWVFAGHDGTVNALTSAGVPAGEQRWLREWYVDQTGSVDTVLGFGWSDSGLVAPFDASFDSLYYRAPNSSQFTKVAFLSFTSGDQMFFNLTAAELLDGYYTLGSAPPIPEPSSMSLLGLGIVGLIGARRRRRRGRPAQKSRGGENTAFTINEGGAPASAEPAFRVRRAWAIVALFVFACLGHVASAAAAEIVYLEIYPNSTGANINISAAAWQYHTGPTGSAFSRNISLNVSADPLTPVNSNPSNPTTNRGYPFLDDSDGDRALFWTDEYTVDGNEFLLSRFRWFDLADGSGGTDPDDIRFAVQVNGGTWYATDQSDAPTGNISNTWRERDLDLTTATWQVLDFTVGSTLALTGPTGLALPDYADITAFGIFKPAFNTTFRPDNFTLFAVVPPPIPEPSSLALVALCVPALAGCVKRRKRCGTSCGTRRPAVGAR